MKSKPFRARWKTVLLVILGLWLAVVMWGLIFAWRRAPEYLPQSEIQIPAPIMDNDAYGQVINHHERPYLINIEAEGDGALFVYGAEHTKDPKDPQIADIETRWLEFHPTVALVESRLGIMFPGLMDPVETFSERGLSLPWHGKMGFPPIHGSRPFRLKWSRCWVSRFRGNRSPCMWS